MMASGLTVGAAMMFALAEGVLAASFVISNQQFKVAADRIEGSGLIQYGTFNKRYDGTIVPVLVFGLSRSKTTGLCQSTVVRNFPIVGTITMKVTAKQVSARDSYSSVIKAMDGTVTLKNSKNGVATGSTVSGPGVRQGDKVDPASSAQEAEEFTVTKSKQIVAATSASITHITGSKVRFYRGVNECF